MEIKNLEKAAKRILKAIKNQENIVVYGDADLDGVTSVIILKETIQSLGGKISAVYFPEREVEGYGVTEAGLNYFKKEAPALLITLDCGIGNFKELKLAKKLGFERIIVDHHEILDQLPEAEIIVDPKQKGDKYPFKGFAAVGLAFKLSESILKDKMSEGLKKNFLELVAMATIADMMPQVEDNAIMIQEGLGYLESSWRPGLQALLNLKELSSLNLISRIYKINSVLNVRDVKGKMPASFRILTALDRKKAENLAERLYEKNLQRKEKISEVITEIERKIPGDDPSPVIFEGSIFWEESFLGVVASTLSKDYNKPAFLYKKLKEEAQGSIRAPVGYNVVQAMKTCSKCLLTFGGHPQAAGFRIKNENLEEFKECLIKYFKKKK